jgi:hypothetical protein
MVKKLRRDKVKPEKQPITALETINVMKELHNLMVKNGSSKDDIATVDKVVLAALGAPTLAEVI